VILLICLKFFLCLVIMCGTRRMGTISVSQAWRVHLSVVWLVVNVWVCCVGELVVSMKFISYNIKGLWSREKRKDVRKLVKQHRLWILCFHKTKLGNIDDFICASIWGSTGFNYSYRPSVRHLVVFRRYGTRLWWRFGVLEA